MKNLEWFQEKARLARWRAINFAMGRAGHFKEDPRIGETFALDLGCGVRLRNPFNATHVQGVDIAPSMPTVQRADLTLERIPFADGSFTFVTAYDFLEHIPRILYVDGNRLSPFITLMNEVHRVLQDGGIFHAETPGIPRREAFTDPTHVNFITVDTVRYFTHPMFRNLMRSYGYTGNFELVEQYWDRKNYYSLVWRLRARH